MSVEAIKANDSSGNTDPVWQTILKEVRTEIENEPALASYLYATILNHDTLEGALSYHLANKLANPAISALQIREIIEASMSSDCGIANAVRADIIAVFERDSACDSYSLPFLYFKGFHALQAYRVANCLYNAGRRSLAYFLQSHIATVFCVDIHPAAKIGKKKKNFYAIFEKKSKKVNQFVKQEKLSITKSDDLIKILDFYFETKN
jgi:serine O-acetyltransferase